MSAKLPLFSFDCRFFLQRSKINSGGERRREGPGDRGMETYGRGLMHTRTHAHVCKNENLKLNKQALTMMMGVRGRGGGGAESTQASSRFVKPRTRGHRVSM